jgi:hypothetical protein
MSTRGQLTPWRIVPPAVSDTRWPATRRPGSWQAGAFVGGAGRRAGTDGGGELLQSRRPKTFEAGVIGCRQINVHPCEPNAGFDAGTIQGHRGATIWLANLASWNQDTPHTPPRNRPSGISFEQSATATTFSWVEPPARRAAPRLSLLMSVGWMSQRRFLASTPAHAHPARGEQAQNASRCCQRRARPRLPSLPQGEGPGFGGFAESSSFHNSSGVQEYPVSSSVSCCWQSVR